MPARRQRGSVTCVSSLSRVRLLFLLCPVSVCRNQEVNVFDVSVTLHSPLSTFPLCPVSGIQRGNVCRSQEVDVFDVSVTLHSPLFP